MLRTIGREIGETSERFTYATQGSNPRLAGPTQVCYSLTRAALALDRRASAAWEGPVQVRGVLCRLYTV